MKKLQAKIDSWLDKFDRYWRTLPLKVQYKYILYFFLGYVILTIGVILKVVQDARQANQGIVLKHIENPVIKKNESVISMRDSLLMILKNKTNERK